MLLFSLLYCHYICCLRRIQLNEYTWANILQRNMGFSSKHSNSRKTAVLLWSQIRKATRRTTKKGKKFVAQLSNYKLLKTCSVHFVACQHSTDPARFGFETSHRSLKEIRQSSSEAFIHKARYSAVPSACSNTKTFPILPLLFLLYCNSALEGIPSLLPDLPLASFRTHQEENQTKKRRRTYEKEKIFF
jgi:hypothetical protein